MGGINLLDSQGDLKGCSRIDCGWVWHYIWGTVAFDYFIKESDQIMNISSVRGMPCCRTRRLKYSVQILDWPSFDSPGGERFFELV